MNRLTTAQRIGAAALTVTAILAVAAPASADWLHFSESMFHAEGKKKKHPKTLERSLVLPTATEGKTEVCYKYANNHNNGKKGKLDVVVEISRAEAEENEMVEMAGSVKENESEGCERIAPLAEGDVVVFRFKFKNMPRVAEGNLVQTSAAIAVAGENPLEPVE